MSTAVVSMFARIAERYDLMNTVITFGLHRRWRRMAVKISSARAGMSVLDCATGTGDFALEFLRVVGPTGRVVATDVCLPMLDVLRRKRMKRPSRAGTRIEHLSEPPHNLTIEVADVLALPYPDSTFDVVSIGYGIRNVGDPLRGLHEMARVTKAGGRVVILETGVPTFPLLRNAYRIYARSIIPLLGSLIARDRSAYNYLPTTAASFPYGEEFRKMMEHIRAFEHIHVVPLLGGVSYIYIGVKST